MNDETASRTNYAVAPGEYLVEWLVENDVGQIDAAIRIGWAEAHVDDLINGRTPVDSATAALLERLTSIPATTWLRYEATYRADLVRLATPATPVAPEPLTTRLARLGASMREHVNKVLVAEAVEALHEAEPEPWVDRYRRRVLDFVGGSADVDLGTVSITSGFEEAYSYSEYTGGGGYFAINVSWKETRPQEPSEFALGPSFERPDEDGLYSRHIQLTNEEVARFLGSLEEA